jgi:hypothetical protein
LPTIQNDQQFIQTMINQGRKKRKLDDDENIPNPASKLRRITIKNEPEQVISIDTVSLIHNSSFSAINESSTVYSISTFH